MEALYSSSRIPAMVAVDQATNEVSPCSPRTLACTCCLFTLYISARRVRKRIVSSTVPVPNTWFLGKLCTFQKRIRQYVYRICYNNVNCIWCVFCDLSVAMLLTIFTLVYQLQACLSWLPSDSRGNDHNIGINCVMLPHKYRSCQ